MASSIYPHPRYPFDIWLEAIPVPKLEGESAILQFIGRWSFEIYNDREMFLMYLHLLFSALFPIYIGSHASLRCPPSAADPTKKKTDADGSTGDDDDDFEGLKTMEGMTPSDAILFPVFASLTLGGLYFLIKWLNDPALLNKILGYYFSLIGIFGVGRLAADTMNVLTTIVFPSVWSNGNTVNYVDSELCQQYMAPISNGALLEQKLTYIMNPLPGPISALKFSMGVNKLLWSVRALLSRQWIFKCYVHSVANIKTKVRLSEVVGLILGICAIIMYNADKAWWLTNLMGFGFCYGTLQIMSPTTFGTGSLVLGGLFIYDIVMVFYTPLMITVATTLDVPIKLVFPHSKREGMLGLGDVVLPGIVMALALRFDLYLFYLHRPAPRANPYSPTPDASPKPAYESATGHWGDRFWTRTVPTSALPSEVAAAVFPKTYFYASIVGYIIGMVTTLIVLNTFNHAQPALLYLVPAVLIALWGTALIRGDLKLMWNYTEAGSTDEEEKHAESEKDSTDKESERRESKEDKDDRIEHKKSLTKDEHAHHVFLLSLSSPQARS